MPQKIQELIYLLNTSSDRAAEKVISKLAIIGKPAVKELIAAASDPNRPRVRKWTSGGIRVNAIDALVKLKDRSSNAAIVRCLSDEQWYVRQHAAQACGHLKIKTAKTKLKTLLKTEKRKAVLTAAQEALDIIK